MRTYAQLTTSFVVFCNRVGHGRDDQLLGRVGGDRARAARRSSARRSSTRACTSWTSSWATCGASGSACRCCATSDRSSTCGSCAGSWPSGRSAVDQASEPAARPAKPGLERSRGRRGRVADDATRTRSRPRRPGPLFELPPELAIDTDVARRVIVGFIREPASSGRLRAGGAGAVGRDRLGAGGLPRRRGDRAGAAAVRPDAVPDLVAGVARGRRGGRGRLGCASELVEISPMVDGYFGREPGSPATAGLEALEASPLRRGNFMARHADGVLYDRSVTWGGLVVGHRQQDRGADRVHDALRRLGLRLQPDRRPVQEPGPPARGRDRRARARSSARRRRPTCGPARPTRPRPASPTRSSTGSCSG